MLTSLLGLLGSSMLLWFFYRQNRNLIQSDALMIVGYLLIIASFGLKLLS